MNLKWHENSLERRERRGIEKQDLIKALKTRSNG
jgi:hypothetical protein